MVIYLCLVGVCAKDTSLVRIRWLTRVLEDVGVGHAKMFLLGREF